LKPFGYALLGQGQASLSFGPGLAFPLKVKSPALSCGLFQPVRRILPWYPRTYKVSLVPGAGEQSLWLGLYPRPEAMAALLLRYRVWPLLERITRSGLTAGEAPAELLLFQAAALAAQGKKQEAGQALDRLERLRPQFLSQYRRLAADQGKNFDLSLAKLSGSSQADLKAEDIFWPDRSGDLGQLDRLRPKPVILSRADVFHMWLPYSFLPGFVKAKVRWTVDQPSAAHRSRANLIVIAVQDKIFLKELARTELKPRGDIPDISLEIPAGPVRLEFRLETDTPGQPRITSLQIGPDHQAEFRWRLKIFSHYLKDLLPR
jgi:hypothetical protein